MCSSLFFIIVFIILYCSSCSFLLYFRTMTNSKILFIYLMLIGLLHPLVHVVSAQGLCELSFFHILQIPVQSRHVAFVHFWYSKCAIIIFISLFYWSSTKTAWQHENNVNTFDFSFSKRSLSIQLNHSYLFSYFFFLTL